MFGPLFQLQWLGRLCPCLEKDEDSNARQALAFVQGRRILWIRSSSSGGTTTTNDNSSFSLGSFFRGSHSSSESSASGPARLFVRDNADGVPEVVVDPSAAVSKTVTTKGHYCDSETTATEKTSDNNNNNNTNNPQQSSAPSFQLNIKLGRVDKVTLLGDEDDIVLQARPVQPQQQQKKNSPPKELVRLRLVVGNNDTTTTTRVEPRTQLVCASHGRTGGMGTPAACAKQCRRARRR